MPNLTDHALSQVGKPMTWDRYEPTRRHVEGVCTAAEPTFSTITNERGSFPGVRFRIKPSDGSRAVWTDTFADEPDGITDYEWVARELARRSSYGACRLTLWTIAGIPVQWAVTGSKEER